MTATTTFAALLQRYFTQRLIQQREASPHTISSYRDTFRQLLRYIEATNHKAPSQVQLEDIDAPLVMEFLNDLEERQGISARSRNLRLTAIRSFFRYAAFEAPTHAEQIQRVLAIPSKRFPRALVKFLTRPEVDALLAAPNQHTWIGLRDHVLLLLAVQTGLRLSEVTSLLCDDVTLDSGAHVRVFGKGRKERCTPLAKPTTVALKNWMRESARGGRDVLFPSSRGTHLSSDSVQYLLKKHCANAAQRCQSLAEKHITFHGLRHTAAMDLLQAGVDRSVIAMWLGHESPDTTQIYLDATLEMKEKALERTSPPEGHATRFQPKDQLLTFLNGL